ncbi:MAG: polysaccharide deacetylase family protein [Candidatus Pacebacteria bacterium]|nr:polysaccharide deacetylase family protein [Candidatus Paceibacterota bacterium]
MKWANFLHIYQPANQQPDILEAVVHQSYRPIFSEMLNNPKVKMTINITGALFELLDENGYSDVIDIIKKLVDEGRLEITGTAKYHALLPFLTKEEVIRQIKINTLTLQKYLGNDFQPKGFFPPEMAYDEEVGKIIAELGFEWIILDEISFNGKTEQLSYEGIHRLKGTDLKVFFRERRPSNLIMSSMVRSAQSLVSALGEELDNKSYLLTAMDGETFGHHRPGLEKLLFEIFDSPDFELVKISELVESFPVSDEVVPIASTWASSQSDIENGIQFLSWSDPENQIHTWQWSLVNLAQESVKLMSEADPEYKKIRSMLDQALASDHFWWASAKPWWSLEEIEQGAFANLSIVRSIVKVSQEDKNKALDLYEKIVSTAFQWKRSGKIYKMMAGQQNNVKIPFKERTFEKGGVEQGIYEAFMDMLKSLEKKASSNSEYEKAILWRDAIYKIETKNDIYDAVHAIELLRLEIPNFEVEETLDRYTEKYKHIRGGQPEQRG